MCRLHIVLLHFNDLMAYSQGSICALVKGHVELQGGKFRLPSILSCHYYAAIGSLRSMGRSDNQVVEPVSIIPYAYTS